MCKKILIIEDHEHYGPTLKEKLEKLGYESDLFVGVNVITEEGELYVLPPEQMLLGTFGHLDYGHRTKGCTLIKMSDYDIALLDGSFVGVVRNGFEVVPALVAAGVVCIGISNGKGSNKDMIAAGATKAYDKFKAVRLLKHVINGVTQFCNNKAAG